MGGKKVVKKSIVKNNKNDDKNLIDLNTILFNQLDRLNKENFTPDKLKIELEKSRAITNLSQTMINNAKILLEADKYYEKQSTATKHMFNV